MINLILNIFFVTIFFLNNTILFINEEFIIFICLTIFFFSLFNFIKKNLNKFFFNKIQYIYFSFIYLIKIQNELLNKILNFINLSKLQILDLEIVEYFGYFLTISLDVFKEITFLKTMFLKTFSLKIMNNFFFFYFSNNINFYWNSILKLNKLLKFKIY